jgi:hypothetical protein
MNTPKTISEIEKEFSKSDLTKGISIERCYEIQTFIRQSINEILDSLVDDKSLKDKSNGRYNREIELRELLNKIRL